VQPENNDKGNFKIGFKKAGRIKQLIRAKGGPAVLEQSSAQTP
jgi:hypothetical protein